MHAGPRTEDQHRQLLTLLVETDELPGDAVLVYHRAVVGTEVLCVGVVDHQDVP